MQDEEIGVDEGSNSEVVSMSWGTQKEEQR